MRKVSRTSCVKLFFFGNILLNLSVVQPTTHLANEDVELVKSVEKSINI